MLFLGAFVLGVTALDRDTGKNGQIEYSLTGASALIIDGETGIVTAARQIIIAETFTCQITATDKVKTQTVPPPKTLLQTR